MHIGEAARISGVTVKAIRHYEMLGLLPGLRRNGSYRVFSDREIARIRLIRQACALGFSLREIGAASRDIGEDDPWLAIRRLLQVKRVQLTRQIEQLEEQRRRLDETVCTIDACLAGDPDCPGPFV